MLNQKEMDVIIIAFSVNESYIPYLCVAINSILENRNKEYFYELKVLYSDIQKNTIEIVKKWVDRENISICFIDLKNKVSNYELYTGIQGRVRYISKETYYRLLLPDLLKENHKVIYLDVDVVVNCDLSGLFSINLGSEFLAAVPDIGDNVDYYKDKDIFRYRNKQLALKNPDDYFNAGVLLLNLDKFRREFHSDELMNIASDRKWRKHDQDILNKICRLGYKKLDFKWNSIEYNVDEMTKVFKKKIIQDYLNGRENPNIIHYASKKPWVENKVVNEAYFWKYAKDTPFYDDILNTLKDNILKNPKTISRYAAQAIKERKLGFKFLLFCFKIWFKIKLHFKVFEE